MIEQMKNLLAELSPLGDALQSKAQEFASVFEEAHDGQLMDGSLLDGDEIAELLKRLADDFAKASQSLAHSRERFEMRRKEIRERIRNRCLTNKPDGK